MFGAEATRTTNLMKLAVYVILALNIHRWPRTKQWQESAKAVKIMKVEGKLLSACSAISISAETQMALDQAQKLPRRQRLLKIVQGPQLHGLDIAGDIGEAR